MNKNIDFKIDNKTVIHATTINEANKLCKLLDKLGARWIDGSRYIEYYDYWNAEVNTCYDPHKGQISSLNLYKNRNYKIISVDDFIKRHTIIEQKELEKKEIDFKIDDKTVVHAKTEEESNKLCELLDKLGATWWHGDKYSECYRWDIQKANTCYNVHEGKFSNLHFYLGDGYKVIPAAEFLKLHEPAEQKEQEKKIDFKIDEKTVVNAKTEEEADKLCKLLDKLGARWVDGKRYIKRYNLWNNYKTFTCYNLHIGTIDVLDCCEADGYKIITVNEFLKLHESKTFEEDLDTTISNVNELKKQLNSLLNTHISYLLEKTTVAEGLKKAKMIGHAIEYIEKATQELKTID